MTTLKKIYCIHHSYFFSEFVVSVFDFSLFKILHVETNFYSDLSYMFQQSCLSVLDIFLILYNPFSKYVRYLQRL